VGGGVLFRCRNTESRQEKKKKNIIVAALIRSFVHDFKKEKMIFLKVDFIRSSEEGGWENIFFGVEKAKVGGFFLGVYL
jgi:hypothetical protein